MAQGAARRARTYGLRPLRDPDSTEEGKRLH